VPEWIASDAIRKSISDSGVALGLFQGEFGEGVLDKQKTLQFLDGLNDSHALRMIKRRYLDPKSISENSRIVIDDSIEKRVYGPDDRISPALLRGISLDPINVPVSAYVGGSRANENKEDTRELSNGNITLPVLLELSNAVGILVPKNRLSYSSQNNDFSPILLSQKQQNNLNICKNDSFSARLALGYCTVFLAKTDRYDGRDLLVTAGHCAVGQPEDSYVVFGFEEAKMDMRIPEASVFEIRDFGFYSNEENDTAVVRLKRPVPEEIAKPIELASNNLKVRTPVCFIGHPDGTAKVAGCGTETLITSLHMDYFEASVDTNQGNSGSPIIDANTHKAIGVLVSGGRDYVYDKNEKCYISDVVPLNVSSFERVSYTNWVEGRINSF